MRRSSLLVALLGCVGVVCSDDAADVAAACGADACDADGELSLKQLRARALATDTPPVLADATPLEASGFAGASDDDEFDDDADDPLPGGWGEAANYSEHRRMEKEKALGEMLSGGGGSLETTGRWSSCASGGCTRWHVRWRPCQCNARCTLHNTCCYDAAKVCHTGGAHHSHGAADGGHTSHGRKVLTLYHTTSVSSGMAILRGGFRPGRYGYCGGGIYFAMSPGATRTKAIGPDSHQGFMLEAKVDVGRSMVGDYRCKVNGRRFGAAIQAMGYDSMTFNPGDGQEFVVFSGARVLSVRHIPWR